MPKKMTANEVETFENEGGFPHGGRTGMDFDFAELCDGDYWTVEQSEWWDGEGKEITADTFLGALARHANANGLRVNKRVSDDKKSVTVRVRPKPPKKEKVETTDGKKPAAKPVRAS